MELKPCPFCNSAADMYTIRDAISGNGTIYIECQQCPATMEDGFLLEIYTRKNSKDGEKAVTKRLIKQWNKRRGH